MKKSLLILAALIAFGGTSAQAQGPKDKLKDEHKKELREKKERKEAPGEYTFFGKAKSDAAKDGGDERLTLTPNGTMQFTITNCDEPKSRPLVIKNNSDERINGVFQFQDENRNNLYSDIELGDYVYGEYYSDWYNREIYNYFEVNGYAYTYNYDYEGVVRTDLSNGNTIVKYNRNGSSYRSLAYDGKTFWAADHNGNIYALDADLNPTGKKIELGYSVLVVWNGTELLTFERNSYPSRVKAFDTNGNLKADYGTVDYYFYYAVNYNPVTGLFWASDDDEVITAFSFENGKVTIKDVFFYSGVVPGFDADGNPYIMNWYDYVVYKVETMNHSPKGLDLSQIYYDLGAGEQATINITALAVSGSRTIRIRNFGDTFATLEINVDVEPEYEATSGLQFNAFAGYNAAKQTVWLKNTGCQYIVFDEEPTLDGGDNFYVSKLIEPKNFDGALFPGDSIGAVIGFYSEEAGDYTDKLTITTYNTEPIEIPFTASVTELNYTIPDDVVTATVDCGANTATASFTFTNNSGAIMTIGTEPKVVLNIYSGRYGGEMYYDILNSEGESVYSVKSGDYSSGNNYDAEIDLPFGEYTLDMYDTYGDGWNGGYVTVIFNGKTLLDEATISGGKHGTASFEVRGIEPVTVANGATINQLTSDINNFSFSEPTAIDVYSENVAGVVGYIYVALAPGEPEIVVAESIDFGNQAIDPDNYYFFGTSVLTIANTGCGPLNISSIAIGDDEDFMFWDDDIEGFTKTLSNVEISPREEFTKTVYFMPSAIGYSFGAITITTADEATTTVQLTGTGIGLPKVAYSQYYNAETKLGFKPDTVGCDAGSVTLNGLIANSGTGPLVITEPIRIEYQAGDYYDGGINICEADGSYWGDCSFYSSDWSYYLSLTEGSIYIYPYGSNGKLIISNGTKVLQTINLAEANNGQSFEFAATETQTINAGDTLELEMPIFLDGYTGDKTSYYYLTTSDPYNEKITMYGKVKVINAPKLVFPEVIDFGEVSVGASARKVLSYVNEGCGDYYFDNLWVDEEESPFIYDRDAWFEPTEAGSFTSTLKVATYYYTVGEETVKDTFEITLKGTAVVSPTVEFEDELVAEIDYDKKIATATATVTNSGTSTALKLMNDTDTIIVAAGASTDIVFEIPIKGWTYTGSTEYRSFSYYTNDAANPYIEFEVAIDIEEQFKYDFNKDEIAFAPVHTGNAAYSTITLRNYGTTNVGFSDIWFKDGEKFSYSNVTNSVAYPDDSITFRFSFYSEVAGTFLDTLYIEHGPLKPDTIPFVGVANNTQVIAVSTPNSRYAVANDTIAINVTFDGTVVVDENEDLEAMPKLKMNTGSFAVLDSTALDDSRDDLYTLTFLYAVQSADNVALFDYTEDSVYMNDHIVVLDGSNVVDTIALPAVGTLSRNFPVTIDNKAPQIAGFDLSQDGMNVDLTVKFSEQVTGFDKNGIKLTGATLNSLKTKDNITFTASVTLEPCVDITVGVSATVKDLAGNTKKLSAEQEIPAIHSYTTAVVAPTCTEEGYTLMTCSLCKHEEKTDVVAAAGHKPGEPTVEVKVAATETTDGKCDTVVVCTVCGVELSRTEGVIPATGNGGNGNAIAEESAGALVYAQDGAIVVEVAEADGCEISVIDINGRVVAKANATSTRTVIPMTTAGVYMVNFEQETTKVVLP